MTRRHLFTSEEDQTIRTLVAQHGRNWTEIANRMNGRTPRQIRERYLNYLAPEIENTPWETPEVIRLHHLVLEIGCKWKELQKYFPSRSEVNIKNQWNRIERTIQSAAPIAHFFPPLPQRNTKSKPVKVQEIPIPTPPSETIEAPVFFDNIDPLLVDDSHMDDLYFNNSNCVIFDWESTDY